MGRLLGAEREPRVTIQSLGRPDADAPRRLGRAHDDVAGLGGARRVRDGSRSPVTSTHPSSSDSPIPSGAMIVNRFKARFGSER